MRQLSKFRHRARLENRNNNYKMIISQSERRTLMTKSRLLNKRKIKYRKFPTYSNKIKSLNPTLKELLLRVMKFTRIKHQQ